jgi:hypothetical protein
VANVSKNAPNRGEAIPSTTTNQRTDPKVMSERYICRPAGTFPNSHRGDE